MTDTPLIRAAKAAVERYSDFQDEHLPEPIAMAIARAVLEAVREPSEVVAEAGMDLLTERGCNPLTGDAEAVWQAMIDAALSE